MEGQTSVNAATSKVLYVVLGLNNRIVADDPRAAGYFLPDAADTGFNRDILRPRYFLGKFHGDLLPDRGGHVV